MKNHMLKEFSKHLGTYFFIIFIPVIALIICYQHYFLNLYKTEIINQETNALDKFKIYFDGKIDLIHKLATDLTLSPCFSSAYIYNNPSAFYDIFTQLNGAKSLDSTLTDIYYYNRQVTPNTIYSCKGTYNIATYSKVNPRFLGDSLDLLDKMASISTPKFQSENANLLFQGKPSVEYIIPVQNQPSYFVFRIDLSLFSEALGNIYPSSYSPYTCIFADGYTLYSNLPKGFPIDLSQVKAPLPSRLETIHQGRYYISLVTSPDSKLTYASLINQDLLLKKAHALSGKFLVLNVLILLSGFTLIFFLTHKYYKPIRRLLTSLDGFGLALPGSLDSLDQVAMGMNLLKAHNKQLNYEKCLLKLLSGTYKSTGDFNKNTSFKDMVLTYSHFKVMTLSYFQSGTLGSKEIGALKRYQAIASDLVQVYALEHMEENMHIILLFFDPQAECSLDGKITAFQELLGTSLSFPYKICVSGKYDDLSSMPYALMECCNLAQEESAWEGTSLLFYEKTHLSQEENFYYPEKELSGLQDALAKQDPEGIQCHVQELAEYMDALDEHHLLFLPLAYTISHAFRKAAKAYNIVTLPAAAFTKAELIQFMESLSKEIIGIIQLQEQACPSLSTQAIINYIQEHYWEYDLTVTSLADHFGLSVSNLSHYFKNATDVKPLAYINSLRIQRAKDLLATTSMTICEISAATGYTQPSSFIRRFKQFTDTTPGEWRLQVKE